MKFRKKPVVIEALLWTGSDECRDQMADFFDKHDHLFETRGNQVVVYTREGSMLADLGDWIIVGTRGEMYPCKPEVFADVYEPAE